MKHDSVNWFEIPVVVIPRTEIGPQGAMAVMLDTEGNQVGLHQEAP